MPKLPTSCIRCGTITTTPCTCQPPKIVNDHINQKKPKLQRGYNYAWERLSKKARWLQPFCTDCGTTQNLTADHTPQAWERQQQGLAIRIQDIDVVCLDCNIKRGNARGTNINHHKPHRSVDPPNDTHIPETPKNPPGRHTASQGGKPHETQAEPDGTKSTINLFDMLTNSADVESYLNGRG